MPNESILLVDDLPEVSRLLARMLVREGYDVVTAASGDEALDALEQRPRWHAAVLDRNLPDMDGAALARRLRGRRPKLPIVFATGAATDAGPPIAGTRILGKPFRRQALLDAIDAVVRSTPIAADAD